MVDQYKFSGNLSADDPTYVERDADQELYAALTAGEFCYVLDSRQTGKSSLRVRIMKQLANDNIKYVAYNITMGSVQQAILSDWYQDQIGRIIGDFKTNYSLDLGINLKEWWATNSGSPLGKYEKFIKDVLLAQTEDDKIVIFIDEIDSVLDFPFPTDDFFAFIRACYEERNNNPEYKRLTFCILGVASPNNLIKDKRRTPFNIGKAITLKPFPVDINAPSFDKIKPLIQGLEGKFRNPPLVMEKILYWTGGQPFLTQKLCQLMVEESKKEKPSPVNQVVKSRIIDNWEFQDEPDHLRTIRDRILMDEKRAFDLLKMYSDILDHGQIYANSSYAQIELKLTGLVLQEGGLLKVYNPIYKEIFNLNWVEVQLGKLRLYIEEFNNWNKANPIKKQLYLLYGDKFEKAWQWKEKLQQQGGDITGREQTFLLDSQQFWKKIRNAFPYECNYEPIIQAVNDWTGGFEEFNNIIFEIVRSEYQEPPAIGTEKGWMGDLVTSHLSRFCQPDSIEKEFMDDNDPNIDHFRLICSYQEILQTKAITFDESTEHKKLADMCLIIKNQEDKKLRILNKIYEYIFNQEWVNKILDYICPYAKVFQSWQASGCQDESLLLKGEDLQKALDWIQKKDKLSGLELEFIIKSLVWDIWSSTEDLDREINTQAVKIIQKWHLNTKLNKNNNVYCFIHPILEKTKFLPWLLEEILNKIEQKSNQEQPTEQQIQSYIKQIQKNHAIHFLAWLNNDDSQSYVKILKNQLDENEKQLFEQVQKWLDKNPKLKDYFINHFLNNDLSYETLQPISEYFNNALTIINELKLLTYDTIRHKVEQAHQLDLIFSKEIKIMAQNELNDLLNEIVGKSSQIEGIVILGLRGRTVGNNSKLETDNSELYQILHSETFLNFKELKIIPEMMDAFGKETKFGNLDSVMFKFQEGLAMAYFTKISGSSFGVFFISKPKSAIEIFEIQCEGKFEPIQKALEKVVSG